MDILNYYRCPKHYKESDDRTICATVWNLSEVEITRAQPDGSYLRVAEEDQTSYERNLAAEARREWQEDLCTDLPAITGIKFSDLGGPDERD